MTCTCTCGTCTAQQVPVYTVPPADVLRLHVSTVHVRYNSKYNLPVQAAGHKFVDTNLGRGKLPKKYNIVHIRVHAHCLALVYSIGAIAVGTTTTACTATSSFLLLQKPMHTMTVVTPPRIALRAINTPVAPNALPRSQISSTKCFCAARHSSLHDGPASYVAKLVCIDVQAR